MTKYDVIVVGAGPAGSATARDIARAGFRVALLENHHQVGTPLHCSGLVTPRTLALAAVADGIVHRHITGAFIHSPGKRKLAIGGGRTRALVMDRIQFDKLLAEQAQAAGADLLLGTRFIAAERSGDGIDITCHRGNNTLTLSGKLLVGADGVRSQVARWLGLPPPPEIINGLGGVARLKVEREEFVEVFVGNQMAPGWFGWIIPATDGRVRIGIGTANGVKPVYALREMLSTFSHRFEGIEIETLTGGGIPIGMPGPSFADNVMLVGDAAGQVKPTSGGGIYMSLVGARHCAQTAIAALEQGDLSRAYLSRYEKAWQREIGAELERGRDLRRVFLSLKDEDFEQLLALLDTPELQRLIARYGDIDFPSSLFVQLVYAAPSLLRLFLRRPLLFPSLWLRVARGKR